MNFEIISSKLTGTPDENGWTQIYEFKPENPEESLKRGVLFILLSTKRSSGGVETVALGREVIKRLYKEYYSDLSISAFNALRSAVDVVRHEFVETLGEVEIAAISCLDGFMYLAAVGGAKILIYRKGTVAEIVNSKNETVSASGYPKEEDIVICSSENYINTASKGILNAALSTGDVVYVSEQIAPNLHSSPDQSRSGVIFIKFTKTKTDVETADGVNQSEVIIPKQEEKKAREHVFGRFEKLKEAIRPSSKQIYIRSQTEDLAQSQGRKTAMTVGIIILILLILSIVFGIKQKTEKDRKEEYQTVLTSAKHEFEEARELFALNPQRSRELFAESKVKLENLTASGIDDNELATLWNELMQNEGIILGEYKSESNLFVDLTLQSDDFRGSDMSVSNETVFVLDKESERALSIEIGNKKTTVLAGPSLIDNAKYIASYSDRAFILSEDSVFEVGDEKRDLLDKDWEGEALPYAYTGNFYILDKGNSQIYRYSGTGRDFSSKSSWLSSSVEVDLGNIVSWVIDGNIWMLTRSGEILRFSLGNLISFNIDGVSPEFSIPVQIFTNDEINHLYILDPQNKRIVVLDKEGKFKAQYVNDELGGAIDFGVSEELKKIIFLTPGKLVELEVRHL